MKRTHIIIIGNQHLLVEYDFLFTMSQGDIVTLDGKEYKVVFCNLEINEGIMEIFVE